jgi:hypothetical protein
MENAIGHEKKEKIDKAKAMEKVPLSQLDALIKERRIYATMGLFEEVERLNDMIRKLLAV